jgi:phospholipase/carboxylesterase
MPEFIHKFVPSSGAGSTVLLLHEEGANENDLIPIGRAVAKGSALLSPRLRVSPDIAAELAGFVVQSAGQYGFDLSKVYGLGYSSGADLAAGLMLLHPEVLAGAILLRGRLLLRPEALPEFHETPVLILAGQHDPIVRPEDTEHMARSLTSAGGAVEVHWMNEGHDLCPEDFQAAAKWMRARLE